MTASEIQDGILRDTDKNGKDRHWKERKEQSLALADAFRECMVDQLLDYGYSEEEATELVYSMDSLYSSALWVKKSDATNKCADVLEFVRTEDGRLKLYRAWFCKDRLCPMCNWRRAMKFSVQIAQILSVMAERQVTGRPIFLTPTMRNVKGGDIGKAFSDFADSFRRLMQYKAVKTYAVGAIRSSEITYNAKRDDYNVHIHCLIWMRPGYFKGKAYLSQKDWTELWKKAARLDYTPVLDVKAVKPKTPTEKDPTGLFSAVLETSKYPIKPDAFTLFTVKVWDETPEQRHKRLKCIRELEEGMRGKRLISFFGIFKDIRAELKQDDIEDGDLVNADGEDIESDVVTVERYDFNRTVGNYCHQVTETIKNEYSHDWHTK